VAAAALLNLAVLGTFGWSELVAQRWLRAAWLVLVAAWVGSVVLSLLGTGRRVSRGQADLAEDAFEKALEHYLKGDWFQAERLLSERLCSSADDLETRLMMATLLRHTGRLEEAAAQLDLLERFEGAGKWEWEIRRERELLAQAKVRIDEQDEGEPSGSSTDPPTEMVPAA
jgi:thioredoxin-like negative regulator of GroEL